MPGPDLASFSTCWGLESKMTFKNPEISGENPAKGRLQEGLGWRWQTYVPQSKFIPHLLSIGAKDNPEAVQQMVQSLPHQGIDTVEPMMTKQTSKPKGRKTE